VISPVKFNSNVSCQGEDIAGLDVTALEEMQNLHVEAITKICHAKVIALLAFFLISLLYMLASWA
jgi:hypothetical protein